MKRRDIVRWAAVYCRLSDEDKDKAVGDDSQSIQNQRELLTDYAHENGWEIYDIYSDDDWSGLDENRPEWNRMIEDAEQGRFDIILCKSQARFTRDMELVEKYLHKLFPIWGVRFIGYADYADTDNRGNKKQRQINGLTNEWYCEDLSNNVRVVFDKKRKDGSFIGSIAPYGYKKDPDRKGHLIIDEEAADVVKNIFELYLQGNGSSIIARLLNERGEPNPTKYKNLHGINWKNASAIDDRGLWNRTTIKRVLKNQMYLGDMVQGVSKKISYKSKKQVATPPEDWIIVRNMHEPIIDRDSFNLVQGIMGSRRKSEKGGDPHIFAGKVRCADCGSTLTRITPHRRSKNGGDAYPFKYLRCSMVEKDKAICKGHYIRLDKLEGIVLERLRVYFKDTNEKLMKEALEGNENSSLKMITRQLNEARRELAEKRKVVESLYLDRVNGLITPKQFNELSASFSRQINLLEQREAALIRDKEQELVGKGKEISLAEKIKKYKKVEHLTPRLVNEFIESIFVGEKNKDTNEQEITINWKY